MSRKRRRRTNRNHFPTPVVPAPLFANALERYLVARLRTLPISWEWVGVGLAAIILGASLASGYFHPTLLSGNAPDTILAAATAGDYALADTLYRAQQSRGISNVLGADVDLEDTVYPERRLNRDIETLEKMTLTYPNNRDLLLVLSRLYQEKGDSQMASEYREDARILDPTNEIFK